MPHDPNFEVASFAVPIKGELSAEILGRRWRSVQAILRLATITGSQMQLGPALNLICDLAATIVSFDESPPSPVPYDSLAHVSLTRDFLNDPERYLRHLGA